MSLANRGPCPLQLLLDVQETLPWELMNGLNGVCQVCTPSIV